MVALPALVMMVEIRFSAKTAPEVMLAFIAELKSLNVSTRQNGSAMVALPALLWS